MADEADIAAEAAEHALQVAISKAARRTEYNLEPDECCHACRAEIPAGRLFCNDACAARYDHQQRMKA
jgi:hypothetical protein